MIESSFDRLQKRAFGGEDVATRPGVEDDDWWPKGPLLPGVEELIKSFTSHLDHPNGIRLVFLLGGAGNGKSFATRSLGMALGISSQPNNALAQRIYSTGRNGALVELLNDATIAPSADYPNQSIALAADIQRWWKKSRDIPVATFCCVNRGIVIDELRALALDDHEISPIAKAILVWLASPSTNVAHELGREISTAPSLELGDHYVEQGFEFEGRHVHLAALSVDFSSLMEPTSPEGPSRAGILFQQIVDRCQADIASRPDDCPIRANVQQWRGKNMVSRWEKVLSHAEIASGRLHSYRDIWGLAALSILGPRHTSNDGSLSLLGYVDRCLDEAHRAHTLEDRLAALLKLSHFRLNNALFGAATPADKNARPIYPPTTPAHAGLSLVDPSIWGSDNSSDVETAMQGIALGNRPSQCLYGKGLPVVAWSPFDEALEEAVVEFIGSGNCSDSVRRKLISWLGGYLTRMLGIAEGTLGNSAVVDAWRECYERCSKGASQLPVDLRQAIYALIFPQHENAPNNSMLLPLFAVRTEPLLASREGQGPKLAQIIHHNAISLRITKLGRRLTLQCVLAGTTDIVGQLILDFALLREALACRSHAGQTEATVNVEPRIERCRAAALEALRDVDRQLVVLVGNKLVELRQ